MNSSKINQTKTLESGVNHSQPNAPLGFSLNVVQKEKEKLDKKTATKVLKQILAFSIDYKEFAKALYDAQRRSDGYSFTFKASEISLANFIVKHGIYEIEFISFYRTLNDLLITVWVVEVE